ncbi:MAG TPA: hypothetical protein VF230_13745 [Acidimicrobiales bacterium]
MTASGGGARRFAGPLGRWVGNRVDEATAPKLDQLTRQVEDVRIATIEVRRIVTDDLDASTEVAALLGRAIAELRATVDDLRAEVAELRSQLSA